MKKAISLLLAVFLGFLLGRNHTSRKAGAGSSRRVLHYVDPMHPSYKSDKPGIAPDCGMQLEPVYEQVSTQAAASDPATPLAPGAVNISAEQQQLVGIRVATVERTSATRTVRIPGRVTADETRIYRVNAGTDGFVRETQNDTPGRRVKKGQHLAVVYSNEFASAIAGYISANEQAQASAEKEAGTLTRSSFGVKTWADRLRNLGVTEEQISDIGATRRVPEGVYIVSPQDGFIIRRGIAPGLRFERNTEFYRIADLSHVWIVADLFGSEAQYFHPGATARITIPYMKRTFSARVSDLLPQIDPGTQTLKVRLEADNQDFVLRPDMYADVDLTVAAPPGLSVPADAVLDSGLSKRVFVDRGNGFFDSREVETGERFGDRVQILKGLAEGEKVVASGTFLVDSESRLRSAEGTAPRPAAKLAGNKGSGLGGS